MEPGTIILIIIIVIIAILVLRIIGAYNSFIRFRNMVDEAFSTMDVYLKKRYDLVPNLVETVKGYAAHESETLERVIKARNLASNATSIEEKAQGENLLTGALRSLFALSEAYPDLKANTNFLDLQRQLQNIEEDIANARKHYNSVVREFNTRIEVFPGNIIAAIFNFTRRPLFEVEDVQHREAVRVEF
ncbi:MAG: LemA family protein [Clostridiales bacterium]|nr:LemA family protein [Clostridiales bacterium]